MTGPDLRYYFSSSTVGYELDTGPLYNSGFNGESNTPVGPGNAGLVTFFDQPSSQVSHNGLPYTARIADSFKTYLVFRPAGDSIWVSLGRVNWGWYGQAFGYINGPRGLQWGFLDRSITPMGYSPTSELPIWVDVFTGSEGGVQ